MISLFLTTLKLLTALWHGLEKDNFRPILLLYIVVEISGTIFYHTIEGWSWLDSLWFAIATSATINAGNLQPHTDLGKIFSIIFLLVSVGLFFSLVFAIASTLASIKKNKISQET